MKQSIEVIYRDQARNLEVVTPNHCPHCGVTMKPIFLIATSNNKARDVKQNIGVFFQCADLNCYNYFALKYVCADATTFILEPYLYRPPIKIDLPDDINQISKSFIQIYSQSVKAESEGLDQIAGIGYRKALEFLIKDYAIKHNPDKESSIKKSMLNKVILEYLSDFPKLQNLAQAATWIGNDETHYVRRHDDKDISDMKQFIKSAALFISADLTADMAQDFVENS
ncbi:Ogr/Delta-like zinc finger protein [Ignatzschineria sp. LJL83]